MHKNKLLKLNRLHKKKIKKEKDIDIFDEGDIIKNVKRNYSILFSAIWNAFHVADKLESDFIF